MLTHQMLFITCRVKNQTFDRRKQVLHREGRDGSCRRQRRFRLPDHCRASTARRHPVLGGGSHTGQFLASLTQHCGRNRPQKISVTLVKFFWEFEKNNFQVSLHNVIFQLQETVVAMRYFKIKTNMILAGVRVHEF